jgi:formamidopyrimidine-DNA glycosylase
MPEFAECWTLGYVLDKLGIQNIIIGKHLIIKDLDYSFGLNGHLKINNDLDITHVGYGIFGKVEKVEKVEKDKLNKLGLNFIYCNEKSLEKVIKSWKGRRKMIGALLIDQNYISGIGIAWASEILNLSNIKPDTKLCDLNENDIDTLIKSMIKIRDESICVYKDFADKLKTREEYLDFVNGWFKNLYSIRKMNVYGKSNKNVIVSGRKFWIN